MTPESQRIAIAEACGWKISRIEGVWPASYFLTSPDGAEYEQVWIEHFVPDYLGDLNAMHEAEKALTEEQCETYFDFLNEEKVAIPDEYPAYRYVIHTTAAQRAEAFLKTLSKWGAES